MAAHSPRISRRKRLLFISMIIIGGWAIVELASMIAVVILEGSIANVGGRRRNIVAGDPDNLPENSYSMMLHPYIGTVIQPRENSGTPPSGGRFRNTEYGFHDDDQPIHKRSPEQVIVAILGGSVARQMSANATSVLEQELSQLPCFLGRSFRFVRLAIDGNKQPQQLMTLSYLLTLGAEFDIVINLDGVNEAALPRMDNVSNGVSAAFPRKWNFFLESAQNERVIEEVGSLVNLRHRRRDSAVLFDAIPLRCSPTALLVWRTINGRHERQILQHLHDIASAKSDKRHSPGLGPVDRFHSEDEMYAHCAEVWSRSSILLHQLCEANETRYFHFLQPNQYVQDSKPMGTRELTFAISSTSPFGDPVKKCFPLMRAKANQFAEANVNFTDLTHVFADHQEQIYTDDCCHVVPAGDAIMATAIAARVKDWYLSR